MTYSPSIGYSLMAVAVLCFFVGAPPWMFLATGLAAVAFGLLGLKARREAEAAAAAEDDDPPVAEEQSDPPVDS